MAFAGNTFKALQFEGIRPSICTKLCADFDFLTLCCAKTEECFEH